MYDIEISTIGDTFNNSSASNFETYKDAIDFTLKNRITHPIHVIIKDQKIYETLKIFKLEPEMCKFIPLSLDTFKNKTLQIYISDVAKIDDCAIIKIPNAGHVKIFLNIN